MSGSTLTPSQPSFFQERNAVLSRNWWAVALRGVLALLFGFLSLVLPFVTLTSLVLLFALYALADGAFAIVSGVRAAARHERWGLLILEGVVNLLAGVAALFWPGLTLLFLVLFLGFWAMVSGGLLVAAAFRVQGQGRWWLGLSGVVSFLWGLLLSFAPVEGAVVLAWWMGLYALMFGAGLLVFAWNLRARHVAA